MAKKDPASKRLAEEIARANARYTINLQRAFGDLLPKLQLAYGQPARDVTELRSQYAVALLAIAGFLDRMGPDGDLAHFADQFAKLAQTLQDLDAGVRAPILTPALTNRGDPTVVWLARACVALAVEIMCRFVGHSRKSAAEWAAKRRPDLKQLITESGAHIVRSRSLEQAIISWCEDFRSGKVKNHYATQTYSKNLKGLEASVPSRDKAQDEDRAQDEADRLLQEALRLLAP
jgi:hypothetical protein